MSALEVKRTSRGWSAARYPCSNPYPVAKMIASGIKSKFRLGVVLHELRQQLEFINSS
jgi:hypothetical protein